MDRTRRKVMHDHCAAMENGVKFGFWLFLFFLAVVTVAVTAAQPSFAKAFLRMKAHHAHSAAAKGEAAAHGPIAKDAHSTDGQAKDSGDADVTVAPSHPDLTTDRPRAPNVNLKTAIPGNYQARRPAAPGPSDTVPRNAIGVAIVPQKSATASSAESLKPMATAPPAFGIGDRGNAGTRLGEPGTGMENSHPAATASVSFTSPSVPTRSFQGRSGIDGSTLIRPSVALSGLGGPAKTVAGINGTALRPKY